MAVVHQLADGLGGVAQAPGKPVGVPIRQADLRHVGVDLPRDWKPWAAVERERVATAVGAMVRCLRRRAVAVVPKEPRALPHTAGTTKPKHESRTHKLPHCQLVFHTVCSKAKKESASFQPWMDADNAQICILVKASKRIAARFWTAAQAAALTPLWDLACESWNGATSLSRTCPCESGVTRHRTPRRQAFSELTICRSFHLVTSVSIRGSTWSFQPSF